MCVCVCVEDVLTWTYPELEEFPSMFGLFPSQVPFASHRLRMLDFVVAVKVRRPSSSSCGGSCFWVNGLNPAASFAARSDLALGTPPAPFRARIETKVPC
jgi:hypothetical protein